MATIKIKSRHPLSKKERKAFRDVLAKIGIDIKAGSLIERARIEVSDRKDIELLIVDGSPVLVFREGRIEPLLCYAVRTRNTLGYPKVIVDRGASVAVARGANLMLPGIKDVEGAFNANDVVVIVDEESGIPVAVGKALLSSTSIMEALKEKRRGVAVKTLQRPGDRLWKLCEII